MVSDLAFWALPCALGKVNSNSHNASQPGVLSQSQAVDRSRLALLAPLLFTCTRSIMTRAFKTPKLKEHYTRKVTEAQKVKIISLKTSE